MLGNKRSHRNEKPEYHNWRAAPTFTATRGMPMQQQRPSTAKNKLINNFFFFMKAGSASEKAKLRRGRSVTQGQESAIFVLISPAKEQTV